jgi:hypothetical protein
MEHAVTIAKEAVNALHQRLKDLSVDASPDELAYLSKALESMAGQSTVYDLVNMSDEKLQELLDAATQHLADLDTSKTNALSSLQTATDGHVVTLNDQKDLNVTDIDTAGLAHQQVMTDLVAGFSFVNDVPEGSTILTEVAKKNMIESGSLPFLFGIINRYNDYWGYGTYTSELGQWYNNTTNIDYAMQMLTGSHGYSTQYASFYKPPQLSFIQGINGMYIFKEMYARYSVSSYEYTYPYALVGTIFIKNTTDSDITSTFYFGGSAYWSSGYEGLGAFVATPNNNNDDPSAITGVTWSNIYSYAGSTSNTASSANITVPANTTVAILLYSSSYYYTASYNHYTQFMHWHVYNFRSNFLVNGLEVDVDRTMRAWQCRGLQYTYQLWN